jgi:parallel beta-helix repeat protein
MVRRVTPVIIALATASCLALGAGPASANHVGCGDTITSNTKLDSNLTNCPNNGIVIGANKITLDLNGHTIDGDDELVDTCPGDEFCDVGVANDAHNGVTITDGKLREFGYDVIVFGARENRLRGLSTSRSLFSGMIVGESPRTRLRANRVFANGLTTDEAGIIVFNSRHVLVGRNRVSRNGDIGLVMDGFDRGRIVNNRVRRNPETGMVVRNSNRNAISHNRVSGSSDGIIVADDNRVTDTNRNAITRNHVFHIPSDCGVGCGSGIIVERGRNNRIAHNLVGGASEAGIRVGLPPGFLGRDVSRAVDTVVRGNRLRRGNKNGVLVEMTAKGTLLRGNRARRSKDDGFDVNSHTTTLRRNRAVHNGDFGIEAVRGVIDRGGNKAHGNGDPRQCTHVACT